MATRSGGGKLLRKPKPGYDQEFTLPRGTSAAPIKQVAKKVKKITESVPHEVSIQFPAWGALIGHLTRKDKPKKKGTKSKKKQKGTNPKSKIIAKKYFKGTF